MKIKLLLILCFNIHQLLAWTSFSNFKLIGSSKSNVLSMDNLDDLNNALFTSITDKLVLKQTDFTGFHQVNSWNKDPYSGSCEWWDETKGSKLTGVSKYSCINSNTNSANYNIDGWMGPSLLVPHMTLTFGSDPSLYEGYSLTADFIPRGPTPLGADMNLLEKYYGLEQIETYDKITSKPNVKYNSPPSSFSGRLLRSPLYLSVSGLTFEEMSQFATVHVNQWLAWVADAVQVDARQRGAINSRDDKLRQFFYRAMTSTYKEKLLPIAASDPDFIRRLSAASTGPIAEAYVGGGS